MKRRASQRQPSGCRDNCIQASSLGVPSQSYDSTRILPSESSVNRTGRRGNLGFSPVRTDSW